VAPSGDFQISYRGPLEELDAAYEEFVSVAGLTDRDVMRLPTRP
jgi:hypothetical protein